MPKTLHQDIMPPLDLPLGAVIMSAYNTVKVSHCIALGARIFETESREWRDQGEWEGPGSLHWEAVGLGKMWVKGESTADENSFPILFLLFYSITFKNLQNAFPFTISFNVLNNSVRREWEVGQIFLPIWQKTETYWGSSALFNMTAKQNLNLKKEAKILKSNNC